MVHIREAKEDRNSVAMCIAERFYVADIEGDIGGVMAISDCNGRAARVEKASLKKQFGFLKGLIGALVLREEFIPEKHGKQKGFHEKIFMRRYAGT